MNNKNKASFGGALVLLGSTIVLLLYRGLVVSVLWNWFIAKAYNLQTMDAVTGTAIVLIVFAISGSKRSNTMGFDELLQSAITSFAVYTVVLVIALLMSALVAP